jgi:hypothetical protein
MLTECEVLAELRRIGVKDPSLLRKYLGDFEKYMEKNHGMKVLRSNENKSKGKKWTEREREKFSPNRFPICKILIPVFVATQIKMRAEEKTEEK